MVARRAPVRIGTAGWALPRTFQSRFPGQGSHLERYARVLDGTELNRTFRSTPRAGTLERWAASVPVGFRFAVKLPAAITHERRLAGAGRALDAFLEALAPLARRLGPLLVQLPPSLAFDGRRADGFLRALRARRAGPDAIEARHPSWFGPEAERLLARHRMARVAADPPRAEADGAPGGFRALAYFRLHGRPRPYYSAYREEGGLEAWAGRIRAAAREARAVWVVFDNTAAGEGTGDALALREILGRRAPRRG